jgi:hypothetical protein
VADPKGGSGADEPVERFQPTSGRIMGTIALVLVSAIVVIGVLDREHGFPLPVVLGAVVFGILVWAAMLRPRVWATGDDLVMRIMLNTAHIPLAAIEQVAVRQVLAVSAGERRFVSPAIGRSLRQTLKSNRTSAQPTATPSYPVFVEERISQLADDARTQRGVRRFSEEQVALGAEVRTSWAWPEIVGLVGFGVAFLVSLFV